MQMVLIWGIWALLTIVATWRVVLAAMVAAHSSFVTMEGAAVIQWRRLDEFMPWVAIGALLLLRVLLPVSVRQGRAGLLLAAGAAVGVVLTAFSIPLDQMENSAAASFAARSAVIVLAIVGAALALLEVRAVLRAMQRGGATILDIWCFTAAQWGLLMVAGLLFMAVSVRREDLLAGEQFRNLVFMMPAAGVLPNALMAGGILWWDRIARARSEREKVDLRAIAGTPRVRAWGVAFLLVNAGGLLLMLRQAWTGIPGGLLEILGIVFYLLGMPREFWRGVGGKAALVAWGLVSLALGARMIESIMILADLPVPRFYSGAWRHIWTQAIALLLTALAVIAALNSMSAPRLKRVAMPAATLLVAGILLTAGVWLATAGRTGESQVPVMRWSIVGVSLELLAMIVAGVGLLLATASRGKHASVR